MPYSRDPSPQVNIHPLYPSSSSSSAAMASKRNGRTYQEEGSHSDDQTYRQSRSTRQEDAPQSEKRASTSTSSRESRESSMASENMVDAALGSEQSMMAAEAETTEADPAGGRDSRLTHPVLALGELPASIPLPSITAGHTSRHTIPKAGRPANFGVVVPGVYRSSYPTYEDFGFVKELGLKTIVTLGRKDEPDQPYVDFMAAHSIRHHIIDMKGTKKESIPIRTMKEILRIVLDQQHYPLMIHCNHGKHRTGCVVAVVRKVSGWKLDIILDEYRTYAEPKVRECDVDYITTFELSQLSNLFVHEANVRFRTRAFYRATVFAFAVLALWAVSSRQITYTARSAGALR